MNSSSSVVFKSKNKCPNQMGTQLLTYLKFSVFYTIFFKANWQGRFGEKGQSKERTWWVQRERWKEMSLKKSAQIWGGAEASCSESWPTCSTLKSTVTFIVRGNAFRKEVTIRTVQFCGRPFNRTFLWFCAIINTRLILVS